MIEEVHIFYSKIRSQPIKRDNDLLKNVPESLITKNKKYIRWQDRDLNIIGKLLLIEGLKLYKLDIANLEELKYTKYGKPYLDLDLEFNISHSGEYVICALTKGIRLGVDIEKIQKNDLNSFSEVFTQSEFKDINSSNNLDRAFYNYWTIKESVIKAIGKGLSIPLKDIKIKMNDQISHFNNEIWHIQNLKIDNLYTAHIATNHKQIKLNYHSIDYYKK